MSRGSEINDETIHIMRQQREDGRTMKSIAEEHGVSISAVQWHTTPYVPERLGVDIWPLFNKLIDLAWKLHPDDLMSVWVCPRGDHVTAVHKRDDATGCTRHDEPLVEVAMVRGLPGMKRGYRS